MRSIKTSFVPVCVLISALSVGCKRDAEEGDKAAKDEKTPAAEGPAAASMLSDEGRAFITQAAQENVFEVEVGRLVKGTSQNDAIEQLATKIIDEHGKANEALAKLASDHGMEIPTQPSAGDLAAKDELAKKTGKELDDAYVDMVIAHHEKTIDLFQKQAERTEDPALKSWASQTLPILRGHLDQAKRAKEGLDTQAALTNPTAPNP